MSKFVYSNIDQESNSTIEANERDFMDCQDLQLITQQYQQRCNLCEDVDYLEKISGISKFKDFLAPDSLLEKLDSSLTNGISQNSIMRRISAFGSNRLDEEKKPIGFLTFFFQALNDLTLIVLIISIVISTLIKLFLESENRGMSKIKKIINLFIF